MELKKAVIPVAGFGTRMLPAAKAVPKELLPILDKPTVQYVVEEVAAAGIDDILFVTSKDKRGIEDHFDRAPELEQRLKAGNKDQLLKPLQELIEKVKIHSVRQPEPRGLGDAVYQARRYVNSHAFACLLGDTIFSGFKPPARELAEAYKKLGTAIIGLEEVPAEKVERYGIVGGKFIGEKLMKIDSLVEKPSRENSPSRYAIAARYVLTPGIFDCLEMTPRGKHGEVQLTDALKLLLEREPIHGVVLESARHDIGNSVDWLKTNLLFASRQPEVWKQLVPMLQSLLS